MITTNEELSRLRKAVVYADIIDAGGLVDALETLTEGQWAALAIIAQAKPPSVETCAVVRQLIERRQEWRKRLQTRKLEVVGT